MEFRVIQALNKSNSKDGWFELERYQFEKHSGTNYITPSM